MPSPLDPIGLWFFFGVMFPLIIVYLLLVFLLFRRLKKLYPDTYRDLGRPTLFDGSLDSGLVFLRFVFRRPAGMGVDDVVTKLQILAVRTLLVVVPVIGTVYSVLFLVCFFRGFTSS